MTINANNHNSVMQNDMPNSFKCLGITSDMTKNGNVKMAHDAMNITKPNEINGIQLNVSTEYCHVFSIIYTPNTIKPKTICKNLEFENGSKIK